MGVRGSEETLNSIEPYGLSGHKLIFAGKSESHALVAAEVESESFLLPQ